MINSRSIINAVKLAPIFLVEFSSKWEPTTKGMTGDFSVRRSLVAWR